MAEHINHLSFLSTGGHAWEWSSPAVTQKRLATTGVRGEWIATTAIAGRPGRIKGVLKASGADKAAADAALTALEAQIEELHQLAVECPWEDDRGETGTALVVTAFRRVGGRVYGAAVNPRRVWQFYELDFTECNGI